MKHLVLSVIYYALVTFDSIMFAVVAKLIYMAYAQYRAKLGKIFAVIFILNALTPITFFQAIDPTHYEFIHALVLGVVLVICSKSIKEELD